MIIKVPLDGKITEIQRTKLRLTSLVLDIENPRIQYYLDSRLNENITPEEVKLALAESNEQYERLKSHIEQNGGIYNPIWVLQDRDFYKVSLLQNSPFVEKENKLPYCRKAQFSKNTLAGSSNIGINRF